MTRLCECSLLPQNERKRERKKERKEERKKERKRGMT